MGITRREAQAIERYEAGESVRQIAAGMGVSESTVKAILANLCHGLDDNGRHRRAMAAGSRELLARITRARVG